MGKKRGDGGDGGVEGGCSRGRRRRTESDRSGLPSVLHGRSGNVLVLCHACAVPCLCWAVLGWARLGWARLGWASLGWAGRHRLPLKAADRCTEPRCHAPLRARDEEGIAHTSWSPSQPDCGDGIAAGRVYPAWLPHDCVLQVQEAVRAGGCVHARVA
eukprot:366380-Chlamydomonas_euryale.AAC.14